MPDTPSELLTLLLPTPGRRVIADIRKGSAIVGSADAAGSPDAEPKGWIVDFEGNIHNAQNMTTFEGRLQSAAGRHVQRYPTTARVFLSNDEVVAIGSLRHSQALGGWIIERLDEPERLAAWLEGEPLPRVGGSEELWDRAAGRQLSGAKLNALLRERPAGSWRAAAFMAICRQESGLQPPL